MARSVKGEVLELVAAFCPSVDDDFYMATFRGGKVEKVHNMLGGPPRRVKRVLDFDSEAEIEKEEALARKRNELASVLEFEALTGKKEKTLAEVLLEMRQRRTGAALATVGRKELVSAGTNSVKNADSVEELVALDDELSIERVQVSVKEAVPVEEVVIPVELSPFPKKRKRRSTSLLHTSSKLLDPSSEPQGDDQTLAEYLKKSVSTTGRASSDNAGIKVFQRRKVKFKAVRKRNTSLPVEDSIVSKSGDTQSSNILVCDDFCVCEPLSVVPPNSVGFSRVSTRDLSVMLTACSTSTEFSGDSASKLSELADSCVGEFDTLTLPDEPPKVPVLHYNAPVDDSAAVVELQLERVELAQQVPSNSAAPGSGSAMPEANFGVEGKLLNVGRGPCVFNTESSSFASPSLLDLVDDDAHPVAENPASVVTPMELDSAVERIESILDTLVTPDDLLPTDLATSISSAVKSTRKKKRRRFSESVALEWSSSRDLPTVSLRHEDDLAALGAAQLLTDSNVSSPVSDVTEEVSVTANNGSSDVLAQQISEHISVQISGQISEQISELVSQEQGPTLNLRLEDRDRPGACSVDVEVVPPSSQEDVTAVRNAEECSSNGSNSVVPLSDGAVETAVETPTQSPTCNLYEDSGICQTPTTTVVDAAEMNGGSVGDTSTSKGLFSNLKADSFSKRNRKSFSPKSQKALLEAARSERSIPTFKIKLMKSNLNDRCSSTLFSQKMVARTSSDSPQDPHPRPGDYSGQDLPQCESEHIQSDSRPQSPPSLSTENTNAPSPLETPADCIVPGSPEYKTEPHISHQSSTVTEPVSVSSSVTNLPCTEGSLHVDVECHPGTPSDPKTPNDKVEPQLKSILKTRSDTCRGICECPRCVSTCDVSATARNFIRSQMRMADDVARKLLDEIRNLRTLVENASGSRGEGEAAVATASCTPELKQAKGALDSATKTEDWATKEMLKMSRDSKRVCRLIEVGPRRTIFADDAGHRLCQVKLLLGKKTLSKEPLLPAN